MDAQNSCATNELLGFMDWQLDTEFSSLITPNTRDVISNYVNTNTALVGTKPALNVGLAHTKPSLIDGLVTKPTVNDGFRSGNLMEDLLFNPFQVTAHEHGLFELSKELTYQENLGLIASLYDDNYEGRSLLSDTPSNTNLLQQGITRMHERIEDGADVLKNSISVQFNRGVGNELAEANWTSSSSSSSSAQTQGLCSHDKNQLGICWLLDLADDGTRKQRRDGVMGMEEEVDGINNAIRTTNRDHSNGNIGTHVVANGGCSWTEALRLASGVSGEEKMMPSINFSFNKGTTSTLQSSLFSSCVVDTAATAGPSSDHNLKKAKLSHNSNHNISSIRHCMAERKRRQKLNKNFEDLRALISPSLSLKTDKASIIETAVNLLKKKKEQISSSFLKKKEEDIIKDEAIATQYCEDTNEQNNSSNHASISEVFSDLQDELVIADQTPSIQVKQGAQSNHYIVSISTPNRTGLFSDIILALTQLNLQVLFATSRYSNSNATASDDSTLHEWLLSKIEIVDASTHQQARMREWIHDVMIKCLSKT